MSFPLQHGQDVQRARQVVSRGVLLAALMMCALPHQRAQAPGAPEPGRHPSSTPPLYQRIREGQGGAVKMTYGVSQIGGPDRSTAHQELHTLSATLACAHPPSREQLKPFALFQWMEKQQAADLGLLFRAADGSERPFLGNEALVWRAGAIAPCLSADGTRIVLYGWEWDVGVAVNQSDPTRRAGTFAALETQKPVTEILAFGENLNGPTGQRPLLLQALTRLSTDWQANTSSRLSQDFLEHFSDAQRASAAAGQGPETIQAIGSSLKP